MDYEQEETQAVLDMADMLLECLVTESVNSLSQIEKARQVMKNK